MTGGGYRPWKVAPLFLAGAVIHLLGLAALFPEVDIALDARLGFPPRPWVIAIQAMTWALLSAIEVRVDHGEEGRGLPVWMQVRNRVMRLSYSLGVVFFVDVVVLRLGLPLGNLDPVAPLLHDGPLWLRVPWFVAVTAFEATLAFVAVGYLVAVGRLLFRPTRRLPLVVALLLCGGAGLGLGFAGSALLRW